MGWFDNYLTADHQSAGHFRHDQLLLPTICGPAYLAVYQCIVHFLSPVIDICCFRNSRRGTQAVEIIISSKLQQ